MTYQASSGDVIVEDDGGNYLKLYGSSNKSGRRHFVLAVTGKGKIKIETYSNTGIWKIYDGSQSGKVLVEKYSGFNTGSKQETETAEIEASTSLYFFTTAKGYIRKITWTPSESTGDYYSFHYGEKGQAYSVRKFQRVGTTNEWRITDFVFPDVNTNQACYVGKGGSWYNDALGSSNAKSADLYFYDMPLALLQNTSCTVKTLGWNKDNSNVHKAIVTLRIFDNYADNNLFVGFIPNGYGLMHGAEGGAW